MVASAAEHVAPPSWAVRMWAPINYITPVQLETVRPPNTPYQLGTGMPSTPVCVHAEVSRVLRHSGCPSAMERIAFSVTTMASHRGSRSHSTFSRLTSLGNMSFSATNSLSGRCPCNLPARNLPACQGSVEPSGHQVFLIKAETQATHIRPSTGLSVWQHLYPSNIWTLTVSLGSRERGIGLWSDLWTSYGRTFCTFGNKIYRA